MLKTRLRAMLGVLLVAPTLLVGCDKGITNSKARLDGSYTLETIGGRAVPLVVDENAAEKEELVSGSIELRRSAFTMTFRSRYTDKRTGRTETEDDTIRGTYEVDGRTITFTDEEDDLSFDMDYLLSGGNLTLRFDEDGESETFVYRRQ